MLSSEEWIYYKTNVLFQLELVIQWVFITLIAAQSYTFCVVYFFILGPKRSSR